ncbi:MAG: 50S ribosomal protein L21 [Zavarzinella sp.]
MNAIFVDGSRQFRVAVGDVVRIDHRDVNVGDTVEMTNVLMTVNNGTVQIGQPQVAGVKVVGKVIGQPKDKVVIQKFRRRKNYRRLTGHSQPYVEIQIESILS